MPVGVLVLVAVVAAASGYWALRFQLRVLDLVNGGIRPVRPAGGDGRSTEGPAMFTAAAGSEAVPGRLAIEALGGTPRSVLGWRHFCLVSIVALDGTAIVACRSTDQGCESPPSGRRRLPRPRLSAPRQWPLLLTDDETLVLLIGNGGAGDRALNLLERWRRAGTVLWLRPIPVAGGIELFDGRRFALRAALLAA